MKFSNKRKLVKVRQFWRKNQRRLNLVAVTFLILLIVVPLTIAAVRSPNNSMKIVKSQYTGVSVDNLSYEKYKKFMRTNFGVNVTLEQFNALRK